MIIPLGMISLGLVTAMAWSERNRRKRRKTAAVWYDTYPPTAKGYAPVPPDRYSMAGTDDCRVVVVGHEWWEGPARTAFTELQREGILLSDPGQRNQAYVEGILRRLAPVCYSNLSDRSPGFSSFLYDLSNAVESWAAEAQQTGLALTPQGTAQLSVN